MPPKTSESENETSSYVPRYWLTVSPFLLSVCVSQLFLFLHRMKNERQDDELPRSFLCVYHFLLSKLTSCACLLCSLNFLPWNTVYPVSPFHRLTTEKQARTSLLSHQKLAFESIDILYSILVSLLFILFFSPVLVSRLSSCSIVSCLFSRVKEKRLQSKW